MTAPGTLVGRPWSGSAMPWHGIRALTEGLSDRTEREAGISCPADTLAIRMAARDFRSESSDNATFDDIRPVGGRASSKRFGSRQEKGDSSDIGDLESLLLGQVILKPSGLPWEAGWSYYWLRERVTGFPGPRPGRANPRMLAWE